jgi:hypothetical protein
VLLKESRRALDIREEKRDGSSRKVTRAHGVIMSPNIRRQPAAGDSRAVCRA